MTTWWPNEGLGQYLWPTVWPGYATAFWDDDPGSANGAVYTFQADTTDVRQARMPVSLDATGKVVLGTPEITDIQLSSIDWPGLPSPFRPLNWGPAAVVPVLQPPGNTGTSQLHLFMHLSPFFSSTPTPIISPMLFTYTAGVWTAADYGDDPSINRVLHDFFPTPVGVVGAGVDLTSRQPLLVFSPWPGADGLWNFTNIAVPPAAYSPAYGCAVAAVRVNGSGTGQPDLSLVLAVDGPNGTAVTEIPATSTLTGLNIDTTSLTWTPLWPGTVPSAQQQVTRLEMTAAGVLVATLNGTNQAAPLQACTRDAPGTWTMAPQWGDVIGDCELPGGVVETQSQAYDTLTDAVVPLYRVWFSGPPAPTVQNTIVQLGQFRRIGLPNVEGSKKLLVGVIEGPPPVPLQNIDLSPYTINASTTLTDSSKNASSLNLTVSTSFVMQNSASVGGSFAGNSLKVKAETDIKAGFKLAINKQSEVTTTTSFSCVLAKVPNTPQPVLESYGLLVVTGTNWAGYRYQCEDINGNVIPTAPVYTEIFPTDNTTTTLSYVLPPDGPQVGQLTTYPLALPLGAGTPMPFIDNGNSSAKITTSWTDAGSGTNQFLAFNSWTTTGTASFGIKETLGVEGSANIFGAAASATVSDSLEVSVDASMSVTNANSAGLTCVIQGLIGDDQRAGTYSDYAFDTYLLSPNPEYGRALLGKLVTATWPTNTGDKNLNLEAVSAIASPTASGGASAPWVITYLLVDSHPV